MKPASGWFAVVFSIFAALWATGVHAGVNTWTSIGPDGGPSYAVAVSQKNPEVVYEASPGGGVFKSVDGGLTWASANVGLSDLGCQSIVIDPTNTKVLYTAGALGVFKSTDGAETWTAVGELYYGRQFAIDPSTPTTIYGLSGLPGSADVVKSLDSGHTWTSLTSNGITSHNPIGVTIDPRTPSTLYVAADLGVFKSFNGGQSWTLSVSGLGISPGVNAVAIDPVNSLVLYAGCQGNSRGVFKSSDGGQTWVAIGSTLPVGDDITMVAVDPVNPDYVYIVDSRSLKLFVSADAGAHWTISSSGLPKTFALNLRSLSIAPSAPSNLYLGTDFGVYASGDRGATWARRNTGLNNMNVNTVAVDPNTPTTVYAGTAYNGMFKSVDNGRDWTAINTGLVGGFVGTFVNGVSSIAINPRNSAELYIGAGQSIVGAAGGVFKSTDAGATWNESVGDGFLSFGAEITALVLDPLHPKTLFASDSRGFGVAESTDAGATWTQVDTGLPGGVSMDKLAITPNYISVGHTNTLPPRFDVYISPYTSGSATTPAWSAINASNVLSFVDSLFGETPSIMQVLTILADLKAQSILNLGGTSNTSFDPGPCEPFTGLFLDPYIKKNFYLTGQCGVVLVTKLGATVVKMNSGLPAGLAVNALTTTPTGTVLFAATAGGGIYKYKISP